MNIEQQILKKVHKVSKIHKGGEKFFDALDQEIIENASNEVIGALMSHVPNKYFIVLSGGFGKKMAEKIDSKEIPYTPYILLKGGIRSGGSPEIIRKTNFHGKRAIFLDDSIYGGATYITIKKFLLKEMNINVEKCAVIYDGCHCLDITIISKQNQTLNFKYVSNSINIHFCNCMGNCSNNFLFY
jgi:hypothetical protein